ncbi:MAG TPA: hypothetical protein VFM53_10470 [Anaeromyxobacteraceae bacterium]|nr:hypothetical protein [Anaeromyxobacteraceae bacterium]
MSGAARRALAASAAAALLASCTPTAALMTPPPALASGPGQRDETTGGLTFALRGATASASWGPWRVSGDGIALAYAGDGAWTGTWNGLPARFQASQGLLSGPGTRLVIDDLQHGLRIHGTWNGAPLDVTAGRRGLGGTVGAPGCTLALAPQGAGVARGPVACAGAAGGSDATLEFLGEAILAPEVLLPQFVLGLLAVLPAPPPAPGAGARP